MNKIKEIYKGILDNSFWSKLIKNVITVLVGNGGSSVINLIVTIIMTRVLGNKQYGIFLLALQYMNLIDGIVNFQSWTGVIKYGSEAIVEEREDKLAAILKSGFLIDMVTAVLGTVIAMLCLPLAVNIMNWDKEIAILAAAFTLEIVFHIEGTSVGILRMFDKFHLTATQSVLTAIIKLFFIGIYVLLGGKSLLIITVLYVVTDVVKHLMLVVMALNVLHNKIGIKKVIKSPLNKIDSSFFKYTMWNNVCYTVDVPVKYFDVFIIGQISVEMVAIYKVFRQIITVLSMLVQPISQAVLPQFSELVAQGRAEEAYNKVMKLRNCIVCIGVVAVLISLILGKPMLNIFFGADYGNNLFLFETLLIMQIYLLSYVMIHPLFASLGLAKQSFMITLFSNIVYAGLAYVMIKYCGIYAVVMAIAVQGFLCIEMKVYYSKKYIKRIQTV